MIYYSTRVLEVMRSVYMNSLTQASPLKDVPANTLKVALHAHQQAVLHAMHRIESTVTQGLDCSGEVLYANYGILGDSVGVGKSLMIMGHITNLYAAEKDPVAIKNKMGEQSDSALFSVKPSILTDISEAGCLLVVPHTLFRQWADYIKKQSSLKAIFLEKTKSLQSDTIVEDILGAQIVLVSNTMYRYLSHLFKTRDIRWKRVFIDEADTVHITGGCEFPKTRFTWYISASWMNLLFPNETLYLSHHDLQQKVFGPAAPAKYACLKPYFQENYNNARTYHYLRYSVTSNNFLRGNLSSGHPLRGQLILRCTEDFIKESISLPPLTRTNILCKASLTQRIVNQSISAEVQQLLHAGDNEGAIQALGLRIEDTTSVVDAVTVHLQKELERLKSTYTFKAGLEYSSPVAKEAALAALKEKIARVETSIRSIQTRIEGFKEEVCPICYDEPSSALLTPCCSRIFCTTCILTSLSRNKQCPMCRTDIDPRKLTNIVSLEEKNRIVSSEETAAEGVQETLLKKHDALMKIFKENPRGRFLVFSRYDNPFHTMEVTLESLGIKVKQMKGNKDAIAATLRAFQSGDLRCLLLNSHYAGAGLNITAATHVILFHAMTHEEEKQILGRAYRVGRSEPLQLIRLLHEDEMTTSN